MGKQELYCRSGHECNGVLLGMILGDSHIQKRKETWNAKMMTPHTAKHRDYLDWKMSLLRSYFAGKVFPTQIKLEEDGKMYPGFRWDTEASKRLNYHHQDFYKDKQKIAKKSVLNRLTVAGLAIWYLDDGWLGGKANKSINVGLSTNCFDEYSLNNIVTWFDEVLGFKFRICEGGSIESDAATGLRFLAIVKPFVDLIPSMRYKVDTGFDHRRTYIHLPEFLRKRLSGEDIATPMRGYVWQLFPKSAMWPEINCRECGTILDSHRKLYCSAACGQKFRSQRYSPIPAETPEIS